jgi:hypothetical protein
MFCQLLYEYAEEVGTVSHDAEQDDALHSMLDECTDETDTLTHDSEQNEGLYSILDMCTGATETSTISHTVEQSEILFMNVIYECTREITFTESQPLEQNEILDERTGKMKVYNSYDAEQNEILSKEADNNGIHEIVQLNDQVIVSNISNHYKPLPSRKRCRLPEKWKSNVRQNLTQSGQAYVSLRGKNVQAKTVRGTCDATCKMKCSSKMTRDNQFEQFMAFYGLTPNEKRMYINRTTECIETQRKKTATNPNATSRRKKTFLHFFECSGERVHVCKKFYLATLAISQKQIYTVHATKDVTTGICARSMAGKHIKHAVPEASKNLVHEHIQSVPVLDSHYRRANSKKKYFEDHSLSILKLYQMYKDWLPKGNIPVKESMYRYIFNHKYNYAFKPPKNDVCDTCSLWKARQLLQPGLLNEEDEIEFERHIHAKLAVRAERERDRKVQDVVVICFDLENVFTMPKCGVSSFFYKRKLTGYNLTAHATLRHGDNVTVKYYCAIWTEAQAGRAGDDLASALITILKRISKDFSSQNHFITWSDSCVPQNKNQMMAYAIQHFLENQDMVELIHMKYCTPGHSAIQEVDNLHSQIEKRKRRVEFFSPISLLRNVLLKVNPNMSVIQMLPSAFCEYSKFSARLSYSSVPFASVTELRFEKQRYAEVIYKCGFDDEFKSAALFKDNVKGTRSAKKVAQASEFGKKISNAKSIQELTQEKVKDLTSMLPYMPLQDQQYFKTLF